MWKEVFGFLDGLKGDIHVAASPDELAKLMADWQVYEMTRGKADVLRFARDLIEDPSVGTLLDKAIATNATWLRDSSGFWSRFHAMCVSDEVVPKGGKKGPAAARLEKAVECALKNYERDAGGSPHGGGAMYAQVTTALLCARSSGLDSSLLVRICRRVGTCLARRWGGNDISENCPADYVVSTSNLIWGEAKKDPVLTTFFPAHIEDVSS